MAKPLCGQSSWEKILKRPGLASGRTFLKAFIFAYLASSQSVRSIVLAHVMHFLILTICVGPIPVRICPSPRSMMWYAHYAHVKGLSPQHCRGAQSLRPPHLRMRHKAHESLQTVHRHLTIMGKAHYNSPKTGFSPTFPCSFALANQGMSQFQGSQGAILEKTPAGHMCYGFSPFLHAAVAAQVCSCTLLQYSVLGFIMPFLAVSEEQKANAKPLEPAFEALLRTVDLDEELITNLRVRNVLDREIFSSLEMNEENFRETIASSCGIDNTNFEHKLETAKLVKAWRTSSLQAEVKSKVDAVQKAHGEPACLIRQFKERFGRNIHASKLPAQSYFEAFQEKLSEGSMAAETLAQVISANEEETQKKNKPEPSRQLGLNLDSTVTIQTRRRYIASMPANFEELRIKYNVMSHIWLFVSNETTRAPSFSQTLQIVLFPIFLKSSSAKTCSCCSAKLQVCR